MPWVVMFMTDNLWLFVVVQMPGATLLEILIWPLTTCSQLSRCVSKIIFYCLWFWTPRKPVLWAEPRHKYVDRKYRLVYTLIFISYAGKPWVLIFLVYSQVWIFLGRKYILMDELPNIQYINFQYQNIKTLKLRYSALRPKKAMNFFFQFTQILIILVS